jgi:hypothetical protein
MTRSADLRNCSFIPLRAAASPGVLRHPRAGAGMIAHRECGIVAQTSIVPISGAGYACGVYGVPVRLRAHAEVPYGSVYVATGLSACRAIDTAEARSIGGPRVTMTVSHLLTTGIGAIAVLVTRCTQPFQLGGYRPEVLGRWITIQ